MTNAPFSATMINGNHAWGAPVRRFPAVLRALEKLFPAKRAGLKDTNQNDHRKGSRQMVTNEIKLKIHEESDMFTPSIRIKGCFRRT